MGKINLNILYKKKLIIFDLDGVIINSKETMSLAWNSVRKELKTKISFKKYFNCIGLPFYLILKKINFEKNHKKAALVYNKACIKNQSKIKLYPGAKKIINDLYKKKITCLVTSKSKIRTKKLLKKFSLKFNYVFCPEDIHPFKPHPKIILKLKKKHNLNLSDIIYIGDTKIDSEFAKRGRIEYLHASYGYGKKNKFDNDVKSLKDLHYNFMKI